MVKQKVLIRNTVGLHARPATFFVQKANMFKSIIWIERENKCVNAKSLLGVLSMGVTGGMEINIIAEGEDENLALETLVKMIKSGLVEEIVSETAN